MLTKCFFIVINFIYLINLKLITMKFFLTLMLIFSFSVIQAQEIEPTYEVDGDKVKATYYFNDGSVHKQGFFKNKKLTGMWTEFDKKGNKVATGFYKDGNKSGTWFQWNNNKLRQINYKNNVVTSVNSWKEETSLATN